MLLKNSFLLPHLFCNVEFEFSWFHSTKQSSEILILEIEMLLEFQNKANIYGFYLMHFGFALELPNVDLLNIDLLDTHLDLLYTDIPNKYFACLHDVFKTSSIHVFKTSSRHVFRTSSRHVFKTSSRRLARCLRDVFKTSWKT